MRQDHNSLVSHLTGYLCALSRDAAHSYLSKGELERDFSRLSHELAQKGSRVVTLDMPALGKHFDRCLDQGLYTPSNLYLGRVPSGGPQVPVFLRDLYLQVFDTEGKLRDAPPPEVILLLRCLFMGAKKLRLPFSERSLRNEVSAFLRIEQEIRRPTLAWDSDDLFASTPLGHSDLQSGWFGGSEGRVARLYAGSEYLGADCQVDFRDLRELDDQPGLFSEGASHDAPTLDGLATLQHVADIIATQFGDLHLERASELPKHGPGAVAEGGKHVNKYVFPSWPRKLGMVFPSDYYASPRLGEVFESEGETGLGVHEPPSRLIAVPKTQKGPRLIAAEPISHQWCQQLVRNQLESRLRHTALRDTISFRDQSLSGDAALRGSVDGSLATIDLSSASDRLSCWLVERAFRLNTSILLRTHACRTRWLTYKDERGQPQFVRLNKFAPMGSAVTFPVQSIIYAMIAVAGVLIASRTAVTKRSIETTARRIRVFGDDIIVPVDAYKVVTELLTGMGLRVNHDKTFGTGRFRESCGVDAFRGDDVTPPYLREPSGCNQLSQLGSHVAVRNNYYMKGFWNVAYWLDSEMVQYLNKVPDVHAGEVSCGRASFVGTNTTMCRNRYNERLQREEVQVAMPYRRRVIGATAGVHRLFQWFIEKPQPDTRWESGWTEDETVITRLGWVPKDFIPRNGNVVGGPLA